MFIHLTLWLDELLINPFVRKCTFDVRSAHYGTGFYLLVMGIWGHVGHDWYNLRHGKAVETFLRWVEGDWVELRQIWGDVRHIVTSQRRSSQVSEHLRVICDELESVETIKTRLKRYETCYDISYSIGMSFMTFDWIWGDLRHVELNLSRIQWRWGKGVTIE